MADVLKKEFSPAELHSLAASFATMPLDTDFRDRLLCGAMDVFLESGDHGGLVTLLSANCPWLVGGQHSLEFYIMQFGKPMEDKILMLFQAYRRADSRLVRYEIGAALRRGFAGHGIHGDTDDDFVKNAEGWYRANKERVIFNGAYSIHATADMGGYNKIPLFFPSGSINIHASSPKASRLKQV